MYKSMIKVLFAFVYRQEGFLFFFLLLWGFIHFLFLGEEVFPSYVQASFIQVVIFYYSKRQLLFVLDYTMTDLIAFAPPVPKPHSDKNC